MSHIRQIAMVSAAALSALTLAPPAHAATTTVRAGSAGAAAYSGAVQANLLGAASVSTSLGGGSCTASQLTGTVTATGAPLNISAATFGGCSGATVTPQNLPWNNGNITYAPVAGGRDATVSIGVKLKAVVPLFGGITCIYATTAAANGYNPTNPNRPDTASNQFQVSLNNTPASKQSGSSFLCPGSATVTANYALTGATSPGVYNQTLFVTS
ncbi:hypothetical protein GCM10027589_08290 [Actinocorallia lasiicapitis]